jgi:SAM-dependent methyltransferase
MGEPLADYYAAAVGLGLWRDAPGLKRYLNWLFAGVPLEGRTVLDVGGGSGLFSAYAASAGAREVVCLEPEAAGGAAGMNSTFAKLADAAGVTNRVRLERTTFQDYAANNVIHKPFDVVLIHNAINHLDEGATIRLKEDPAARETFAGLFRKLRSLAAPGGDLLVTDCCRTHLWPLLGMKNPLMPQIEWHKHQDPGLWASLLSDAGFTDPRVRWSSFNRFGAAGWALLANRAAAFIFTGHFRLRMRA